MRIAALDDDLLQLEFYTRALTAIGHACHTYASGSEFMHHLRRETFDLLIVDWELPDACGPEIVTWAREQLGPQIPILFVTHRQQESDVVQGLACGADDYLGKPVGVAELVARLHALERRAYPQTQSQPVLTFGRYHFTPQTRALTVDGQSVELKAREYDLALFLFRHLGRLLSRDHLRDAVWGQSAEVISRSLDTHVSRLRQQLDLCPDNGYVISAVYGIGYRLEAVGAQHNAHP